MEYQRYKRKYERPFGRGAFFDYALAMERHLASPAIRTRTGQKKNLEAPPPQQSGEDRWDGEGGNSQTRIARRAAQYRR